MGKESTTVDTQKSTDPPPPTLHPPYFQMIGEAISTIKDRTGSSQPAIAKFVEEKYEKVLPPNFRKTLSIQLKKFVESDKLVKVKNSYKISDSQKSKSVKDSVKVIKEINKVTAAASKSPAGKKVVEKTKRLSQVKTPEALKKKVVVEKAKAKAKKTKRPVQTKAMDPEALRKKLLKVGKEEMEKKKAKATKPKPKPKPKPTEEKSTRAAKKAAK